MILEWAACHTSWRAIIAGVLVVSHSTVSAVSDRRRLLGALQTEKATSIEAQEDGHAAAASTPLSSLDEVEADHSSAAERKQTERSKIMSAMELGSLRAQNSRPRLQFAIGPFWYLARPHEDCDTACSNYDMTCDRKALQDLAKVQLQDPKELDELSISGLQDHPCQRLTPWRKPCENGCSFPGHNSSGVCYTSSIGYDQDITCGASSDDVNWRRFCACDKVADDVATRQCKTALIPEMKKIKVEIGNKTWTLGSDHLSLDAEPWRPSVNSSDKMNVLYLFDKIQEITSLVLRHHYKKQDFRIFMSDDNGETWFKHATHYKINAIEAKDEQVNIVILPVIQANQLMLSFTEFSKDPVFQAEIMGCNAIVYDQGSTCPITDGYPEVQKLNGKFDFEVMQDFDGEQRTYRRGDSVRGDWDTGGTPNIPSHVKLDDGSNVSASMLKMKSDCKCYGIGWYGTYRMLECRTFQREKLESLLFDKVRQESWRPVCMHPQPVDQDVQSIVFKEGRTDGTIDCTASHFNAAESPTRSRSCGCITRAKWTSKLCPSACSSLSQGCNAAGAVRRRRSCGFGSRNCEVNMWGNFSACYMQGNKSVKNRTREIMQSELNGGHCDLPLTDTIGCAEPSIVVLNDFGGKSTKTIIVDSDQR